MWKGVPVPPSPWLKNNQKERDRPWGRDKKLHEKWKTISALISRQMLAARQPDLWPLRTFSYQFLRSFFFWNFKLWESSKLTGDSGRFIHIQRRFRVNSSRLVRAPRQTGSDSCDGQCGLLVRSLVSGLIGHSCLIQLSDVLGRANSNRLVWSFP